MAINKKDAVRELWSRGRLEWKLHEGQKKMLASYLNHNDKITTIACSRRFGKSFLLCVLATMKCLEAPNMIVKYICPTKKQVKTVVQPIMTEIFKDCPAEMKAEFKYNEYLYQFPNGSQIQLAGTDGGHHESLRGGKSDLWIVDEAGFCDELRYVVRSILSPTALTTGGRGILASTPSKSPDHDFVEFFLKPAEFENKLIKYTIFDNPMLTKKDIENEIREFPLGVKDPEFRREYLCEVLKDDKLSVIPEFTTELEPELIKEMQRPPFYDAYVSMDIGFRDLTVVLFAYYDFKNGLIYIEDELVTQGKDIVIDKFAQSIRQKEEKLWSNPMSGEFKPPYMRVADNNNLILLNDLHLSQNLLFIPTRKDNKEAAINAVRMKINNKQILIHPRCKTLIYHLRNAVWTPKRDTFARSLDAGHYDAVDSLIYLVRNVQEYKNPYPSGYGFSGDTHFNPNSQKSFTKSEQAWVDLFKARPSSIKTRR